MHEQRLAELASLAPGWNSDGSDPPSSEVIDKTRVLLALCEERGLPIESVDADAMDGIAVYFERPDTGYAWISLLNNGSTTAVLSNPVGDCVEDAWLCVPGEWTTTLDKIAAFLAEIVPAEIG